MDGMGWQNLERLRQLLVGNGGSVLREILKECAQSCMSLQSVVLSSGSALYAPLAAESLFVMSETWTNQLSDDASRGRAMAIYTAAMSIGFASGPLILSAVGTTGLLPYGVGAACALAAMVVVSLPGIPALSVEEPRSADQRRYFRLAPLALGSTTLNAGIEAAGLAFLPLYAVNAGWGEEQATQLIATLMIGAILLQLPIGWLADWWDRRALMIWLAAIAGFSALIWPLILEPRWLAYCVLLRTISVTGGITRLLRREFADTGPTIICPNLILATWATTSKPSHPSARLSSLSGAVHSIEIPSFIQDGEGHPLDRLGRHQ
jgi:MFS family permease